MAWARIGRRETTGAYYTRLLILRTRYALPLALPCCHACIEARAAYSLTMPSLVSHPVSSSPPQSSQPFSSLLQLHRISLVCRRAQTLPIAPEVRRGDEAMDALNQMICLRPPGREGVRLASCINQIMLAPDWWRWRGRLHVQYSTVTHNSGCQLHQAEAAF